MEGSPSAFELQPKELPVTWVDDISNLSWWTTTYPGDIGWEWWMLKGTLLLFIGGFLFTMLALAATVSQKALVKQQLRFGLSCICLSFWGGFLFLGRIANVAILSPRFWWIIYWACVLIVVWYFWEIRWAREKVKEQERAKFLLKQRYLK